MKILMLCNIIIPQVCYKLNLIPSYGGGWLQQIADKLDENENVDLFICAPCKQQGSAQGIIWGKSSYFYGFVQKAKYYKYDVSLEKTFDNLLRKIKPDIVHIFGTEDPRTLAMVRAYSNPQRTVIHIQGLVSVCARHYNAFLPYKVTRKYTFRDFLRNDNIVKQVEKFKLRGKFEVESIKNVDHVMGRTDWDRACVLNIHPKVQYHFVGEILRKTFYDGIWSLETCQKYKIFMSQGNYPIKGLHLALEALRYLVKKYPEIKLYIAGTDIYHCKGIGQKICRTYYNKYIESLITNWELEKYICFTGPLDEEEIKQQYLSSHIFISPSVIENSPNSVGEAMLLGLPVVSSDVGGMQSLIQHEREGFLYQADAPYMLAYYIEKIFENDSLASKMGEMAKLRASATYDRERIMSELFKVYADMLIWDY